MPFRIKRTFLVPKLGENRLTPPCNSGYIPPLIPLLGLVLTLMCGCRLPVACGPTIDQIEGHVLVVEWESGQLSTWTLQGQTSHNLREGQDLQQPNQGCHWRRKQEINSIQRRLGERGTPFTNQVFRL